MENPQPAPGGGVQEAPIDGELNVFVLDDDTDAPLSGVAVQVDEAGLDAPLTGTTDATGLVVFKDDKLTGKAVVTAQKSGYAVATWMGAEGAVVTINLNPDGEPTADTATTTGTIAGWDQLPTPAANHAFIGFVSYSFTSDIGAPENQIDQPGGGQGLPPNACYKAAIGSMCNWSLVSRTGPQMHFALIFDVDTKGTLQNTADDTYTYYWFALKTGINLNKGQAVTGESLEIVTGTPVDFTVTLPSTPAGLSTLQAFPMIHVGDELIPVPFPTLGGQVTSVKVPPLAGALAGGSYDVVVRASNGADGAPESIAIQRGVTPGGGAIALDQLLPLPGGLSANAGTYGYVPVTGAALHVVTIETPAGQEKWSVALLDGRTSFKLPTLSTDPLPAGGYELHVGAIAVDGLDVKDFALDDFTSKFDKVAEGLITFTK